MQRVRVQTSVKQGGGCLVIWGYISASGVEGLVKMDKIVNAEKCMNILMHYTVSWKTVCAFV